MWEAKERGGREKRTREEEEKDGSRPLRWARLHAPDEEGICRKKRMAVNYNTRFA